MNSVQLRCHPGMALVLVMLFLPVAATGEESGPALVRSDMPDWSQWRGPRRDGISEETGLLPSWPAGGPARLWTAAGIGRGYSSPIVADETIYITGDEGNDLVISAFSLDGKLRWQAKNGAAWQRSFPGARSSCTYDHGKLYHMNAHGRLACLDAKTGSELWAVNVLERFEGKNITWGISESLLIHRRPGVCHALRCEGVGRCAEQTLGRHRVDDTGAGRRTAFLRFSDSDRHRRPNAADQQRHQERVRRGCQDGRTVLASVAGRS